jgi:hypothetical protein
MTQYHLIHIKEGLTWLVEDEHGGSYPVCSITWEELQRLQAIEAWAIQVNALLVTHAKDIEQLTK